MPLIECAEPSALADVLIGATGNLLGGAAVTLLWWGVTSCTQRRRKSADLEQKRNAIAIEIAKIRAWLRLLKSDVDRASTSVFGRGLGALGALVRVGPQLISDGSLEPTLGELEHRISMVDAAASRLFVLTTGVATAMRGNEEELEQLRRTVQSEADAATKALNDFEQEVLAH